MINYWIFTVIVVIIICLIAYEMDKHTSIYTGDIYTYAIAVAVVYLVLTGLGYLDAYYGVTELDKKVTKETTSIRSLDAGKEMSASYSRTFTYGYGSLENNAYYYVYMGSDKSGWLRVKLDTDKTYLFFDGDTNKEYVKTIQTVYNESKGNWLFGKFFTFKKVKKEPEITVLKRELHLPHDAIKVEFKADIE